MKTPLTHLRCPTKPADARASLGRVRLDALPRATRRIYAALVLGARRKQHLALQRTGRHEIYPAAIVPSLDVPLDRAGELRTAQELEDRAIIDRELGKPAGAHPDARPVASDIAMLRIPRRVAEGARRPQRSSAVAVSALGALDLEDPAEPEPSADRAPLSPALARLETELLGQLTYAEIGSTR